MMLMAACSGCGQFAGLPTVLAVQSIDLINFPASPPPDKNSSSFKAFTSIQKMISAQGANRSGSFSLPVENNRYS
jgi:hypothetical protein